MSWIYDFRKSKKMTSNPEIIPILNIIAPLANINPDFKTLIINEASLYAIMTSKRPNVTYNGKAIEAKKSHN